MTPDEMIDRLLDPSCDTGDGVLANELLSAFWNGYPIENLRRLFVPEAIGSAAFIASELYQKIRPLLKEVVGLLAYETARVRADAIIAISHCATWEDGWAVAKIVGALGDAHHGVRARASDALRTMDGAPLRAGLKHLHSEGPNSVLGRFDRAFATIERHPNAAAEALEQLLRLDDPVARRFGAAMAVRPRLFIDPAFVLLAMSVGDQEITAFVREAIERPLPPWTTAAPIE
jgi:hypothetical protein